MTESRLAVAATAAKCLHLVWSAGLAIVADSLAVLTYLHLVWSAVLANFADALAADICRGHVAVELLLNEA